MEDCMVAVVVASLQVGTSHYFAEVAATNCYCKWAATSYYILGFTGTIDCRYYSLDSEADSSCYLGCPSYFVVVVGKVVGMVAGKVAGKVGSDSWDFAYCFLLCFHPDFLPSAASYSQECS